MSYLLEKVCLFLFTPCQGTVKGTCSNRGFKNHSCTCTNPSFSPDIHSFSSRTRMEDKIDHLMFVWGSMLKCHIFVIKYKSQIILLLGKVKEMVRIIFSFIHKMASVRCRHSTEHTVGNQQALNDRNKNGVSFSLPRSSSFA